MKHLIAFNRFQPIFAKNSDRLLYAAVFNYRYTNLPLNREGAVEAIVGALHERDIVVGTTGMLSRELFELREKNNQGHEKDFLTVGSMGHASSIALGISMQRPRRQV